MTTAFIEANGLNFEVLTAGSRTSRRLALCLHGFPEHAHSWRFQMSLLARLGYKVWAPNMRGYGASSMPLRVADYALEHLLADVAGLIDAADVDEVVLLAHDWGAVIAWYFAMRRVRPLSRLVIMNVPHPAPFARELRRNRTQMRKSWYVFFFQIPELPERLMRRRGAAALGRMFRDSATHPERFTDADIAVFADNVDRPRGLTAMINYYRAAFRGGARRQARQGLPEIEVPTLVVWGEADMALEKSTTFGTDEHVRDLTVRYLPGISHWVQQDAPETVNAMLEAFLTGAPVPESSDAPR